MHVRGGLGVTAESDGGKVQNPATGGSEPF
jgi:hypothetical protein